MSTAILELPKTARWTIDPAHSAVAFSVKHLMIATVRGRFESFRASVDAPDGDPLKARIEATIDAASIATGTKDRDAHLKSPDFFDAEGFPTLTYVSRRVHAQGDGYRVVGDLTIRGTTLEVPLDLAIEGHAKDPWGKERVAFTAKGVIDRRAFGLTWNAALETGGFVVGDEVKITIEGQLVAA